MRKKSHISLAGLLVRDLHAQELWKHRKAFYWGSILPDCKPSFLTTKHEFDGTFEMLRVKIEKLTEEINQGNFQPRKYAIELGEVIHYMADYFTFPHNKHYPGDLRNHCVYENYLKFGLRSYIKSDRSNIKKYTGNWFVEKEELFAYIEKMHKEYVSCERTVEEDCEYIVGVCYQVAISILQLLEIKSENEICLIS
ncbi:MAG: zinc dependent phospholipase C family protein [Eubacteriales bacterium]